MTLRPRERSRSAAEAIAVSALAFLAGDDERLERFVALAGIDIGRIREIAGRPEFLTAVMDHLMSDEPLLLSFAAHEGVRPEDVVRAAHTLGAGPWERDFA
ncbi:MAG: hypothetical protein FD152_2103 [Xanthobacteraceae bacterium]|nr:MAG: hypothetical protein FD152_2103 [Xanthobacteraceae bacterium]